MYISLQEKTMAEAEVPYIRTWNASLYDNVSRRWINGQLNLLLNAITFKPDDAGCQNISEKSYTVNIDFSNIISINKAQSSIIFTAVTIITKDGNTYWFSSLLNRNSTFLILQHFYQASLHHKPENADFSHLRSASGAAQKRTKFGTALLQSVHDSQTTLEKAAWNLTDQGDQLRNAAVTMEELHEDLHVAERITSGLDSYLGRWLLPPTEKAEELILVTRNDIPDVLDLEVLHTQVTATKIGTQMPGILRVAQEGITILDMKQKVLQQFKWSDMSRIRVISPWEILVTRFLIGQPDLSYDILCTTMPKALRKLEVFASRKLEYMNPLETHHQQHLDNMSGRNVSRHSLAVAQTDSNGDTTPTFGQPSNLGSLEFQMQQQEATQEELITDSEVSELSAALSNLKNMAQDIEKEQDEQLKTIDNLTDSVARGSSRLQAINSKMGKIAK